MKKLFGIFSLLVLTLSNVLPAYTYADTGENVGTIAENMDTAIENSEIGNISKVDEESQNSGSSIDTELIGQVDADVNNALSGGLNNEESETNDNQEGTIFGNITESLMSLFGDNSEEQNEGAEAGTIKETMLITGYKFAYEVKKLANPSFTEKDNYDNIIKYINRADNDNSNGKTTAIISMPGSEYPVKAWFENVDGDGVIYYYTEADKIYLNPNSSYMFAYYKKLITVDLTQFDSTYVENLSYFFYYDESLQSLNFSEFNTSNLTNFGSIIRGSSSIKEIDLSNFDTSHVTYMNDLFEQCTGLERVNLDNFDFSSATSMSSLGSLIFENNPNLKSVSAKNWKNFPANLNRLGYDFFGDAISGSLDVTNRDVNNVTNMSSLFYGLKKLTEIKGIETWKNVSGVADMNHMFQNVEKIKTLNLSGLVTENVTNLKEFFENCYQLEEVIGMDTWDTQNVTSIGGMFRFTNIKTVNLDNWDLRNLRGYSSLSFSEGGSSMFYNANSLTGISARNWKVPEDLYNWIYYWTIYDSPVEVIDVSNWDTKNVKKMNFMFTNISHDINIIGLDTWDTSNVENMAGMFIGSTGIKTLDLSNFDTSKVTNMNLMFQGTTNLKTIYVGDKFVVNEGVSSTDMFSGAVSLIGGNGTEFDESHIDSEYARRDIKGTPGYFNAKTYNLTYDTNGGTLNGEENTYKQSNKYVLPIPTRIGNEFIGWYESGTENVYTYVGLDVKGDKNLYAQWKPLEEKAQETTDSVIYTEDTTVDINDEGEQPITGSTTITLKSKEVESEEVKSEEEKITVKETEIKVSSDKTVEYQGGLEVYLEKTENEKTEIIEGIAKFSSPIAVKIPVLSNSEYVKVQVKHYGEEFGYKGLTLNPVNNCSNGEALNDKYNGENIPVKDTNGEKYALIYTCSASTFVAYTENVKPVVPSPASGGGRTITPTKQETKSAEQEHNSADLEKTTVQENAETTIQTTETQSIEGQIKKIEGRSLTRGEVAVMTNILLDVYPQLAEGRELNEVSEACENYADEQNFTKDEKKAITRLCKLSIMGIHNDDNKPLDEFMVNEITKNDEFSKVINRSLSTYTEKDFSVVKEALKKLEGDEENVVFGTVYEIFMSIKNIFN